MKINIGFKISILVMLTSLIGIIILAYISYTEANKIFLSYTKDQLFQNTKEYKQQLKSEIQNIKYDITMLDFNPEIKGFLRAYYNPYHYDEKQNKTYSQYLESINSILPLMLKQNSEYFQIRILDNNGNEIVKFIKKNNKIINIPFAKLQNKFNTFYFQKSIKLNPNQIFFSKINLNREFNTIEFPIKPTLRVSKVIVTGNKKSLIIINVNAKKALNVKKLNTSLITTFIADNKGYYIFNPKNPNKEFGFEFGEDFRIYYDFPFLKKFYNNNNNNELFLQKDNSIYVAQKFYLTKDYYLVILKKVSNKIFKEKSYSYIKILIITITIIVIIITILSLIFTKLLTKPIVKLTEIAKEIAKTKGESKIKLNIKSNDEIGELAIAFNTMLEALTQSRKEIEHFAKNLEKEVEKKTKELQEVNKNLQKIVEEKVKEVRNKDKILMQQSKMAAMGEMIGAIAHQWRQPLNSLALNIQMLEHLKDEMDEQQLKEFIQKNMQTIKFMSNTIDDFRNFFRKDKTKVIFDIKDTIEKTLNLQKAQLENRHIKLITNLENAKVKGFKNEFMQVILNLISNARDVIEEKKIQNPVIEISSFVKDGYVYVTVKDNAGGIPDEIKDRIFEPYFTTKEEGKGTGLGLYMSKEIIERMDGSIEVENEKDGAKFIIKLKEANESE